MKKISLYIIFLFVFALAFSQDAIMSQQSVLERKLLIVDRSPNSQKMEAEEFAREKGIPIRLEYDNGTILEIMKISKNGHPMYYKTSNANAAKTISTDKLWSEGGLGLDLNGAGIVVGVWDGGAIRSTHKEFEGRVRVIDNELDAVYHATHVAGTIGAAGLRSDAPGMANKVTIDGYGWSGDNSEMRSAAQRGLLVSNHSYGFIQGWNYNEDLKRWEWYGDESISKKEDYNFGFYGEDARAWDEIAYDNPSYMIVKSAGNDRGEGPTPGVEHYVWTSSGWTKSKEKRDVDGNNSYDCIGSQGTSKNILTVGAVNDIPDGFVSIMDVELASFSVFGPTDDGRIKPDIVGNGISLLSASSSNDNSYGTSSGTSMSSPSVAGSLVLLQEHYHDFFGTYMF
ncbi:MAG: S8 family serine peptidase, partial [Bacteroidales bacterium]|nr:S8 family serine peptidase [Bacteroidales bacterium]